MSKGLQLMREGFGDDTFVSLKEWTTPTGEIGVYRSMAYGHLFLLVLPTRDSPGDHYMHC